MDHSRLVHGDQPLGEGGADGGDLRGRQGALLGHLVVQRGPGDVLGGEPRPLGLQVRGHQAGRAAPADPPGCGHLAGEPGAELLVLGQIGADHLECDALPAPVGPQIDHTHAAGAEPPVQSERADDTRSSRRSRIIAMSTPPAARPVDLAQLTDDPACVLRGRALAAGFDCLCGAAHLRESQRTGPGARPGGVSGPNGLPVKGIGLRGRPGGARGAARGPRGRVDHAGSRCADTCEQGVTKVREVTTLRSSPPG